MSAPPPVRVVDDLRHCPFCRRGTIIATVKDGAHYYLRCQGCAATGPRQQTKGAALVTWNRAWQDLDEDRRHIVHEAQKRARALRAGGGAASVLAGATLEDLATWITNGK